MEAETEAKKLKGLPVQLVETQNGMILKRGCTEIRISGSRASKAIHTILSATTRAGATSQQICEAFPSLERPVVKSLIEHLVKRNILIQTDSIYQVTDGNESNLDIFYWHFGEPGRTVTERLNSRRITILGVNYISRQLASSFRSSDIDSFEVIDDPMLRNSRLFDGAAQLKRDQWSDLQRPRDYKEWEETCDSQTQDCLVATSDFGDQQRMRGLNKFCVQQKINFFPIVLKNLLGYIGPIIIPMETACFECLRARQNAHMNDPDSRRALEEFAIDGQKTIGFHPSMASILGDIAVFELTKFYSGVLTPPRVGTLIEVNLLASKMIARKVLKVPRCPICSPMNFMASSTSQKRVFAPMPQAGKQ